MKEFLELLFFRTDVPPLFGWFHIVSLILIITGCVFAGIYGKNFTDKGLRRFLFWTWIFLIIGEIYREFAFGIQSTDPISLSYPWFIFPFQFCSSPLYALPFVIFLPEGRVRTAFMAFLTTFCFFGGAVVMIYPGDVFYTVLGVSIQAMTHHGAMAIVGILMVSYNAKKLKPSFYLKGGIVYAGFVATAMVLNVVGYNLLRANGIGDTFNLFYISPYFPTTLPILADIQQAGAPYPVVVLIYLATFITAASIIAASEYFITRAIQKRKAAKAA